MAGTAWQWATFRERHLPRVGWPEKLLAVVLVLLVVAAAMAAGPLQLILSAFGALAGAVVLLRVVRFYLQKVIWRLRNRLLVAFFFIAVIPIGLIVAFVLLGSYILAGQVASHLVYSRLDAKLEALETQAATIARSLAQGEARIRAAVEEEYPGASIAVDTDTGEPGHGLTLKEGVVHAWARSRRNSRTVTILAPISKNYMAELDPELGAISLLPPRGRDFRLGPPRLEDLARESVGVVPAPAATFDTEFQSGSPLAVTEWGRSADPIPVTLGVRTRPSAIIRRLSEHGSEFAFGVYVFLAVIGVLILFAELISLVIGITISRTMTAAVHNLYEGTQRVMRGDFAHRIPVKGNEQIADLSRSFNTMTENVERLLNISKENERIQAELEIARRVQGQLFPTVVPHIATLEVRAVCQPAREVSGDYYDYQKLGESKTVLALGDVAGKGISAALLMASLQSTLRVQLREWQDDSSTQRLVTGLNHHLFLNTTPEKYATFFLAIYHDGTSTLEYTNAGHLPPMLIRRGTAQKLDTNGMVVGAFAGAQYDSSKLQLELGDLVVCYTDGITELENEFGEQFGDERLAEVLIGAAGLPLEQVEAAVLDATCQFSGSPDAQDDLTMLMVRRR